MECHSSWYEDFLKVGAPQAPSKLFSFGQLPCGHIESANMIKYQVLNGRFNCFEASIMIENGTHLQGLLFASTQEFTCFLSLKKFVAMANLLVQKPKSDQVIQVPLEREPLVKQPRSKSWVWIPHSVKDPMVAAWSWVNSAHKVLVECDPRT